MSIAKLIGYFRRTEGVVSVEFTMILPVLLTLLLASVEVPGFISARNAVADASSTSGDLAAQDDTINEARMLAIFRAAQRMVSPDGSNTDDFAATVTSVLTCHCDKGSPDFCFSVLWSHQYGNGAVSAGYNQGDQLDFVPDGLGVAENDTIIIAEASLVFFPKISHSIEVNGIELNDVLYFRPRSSRFIAHTGAQKVGSTDRCPDDP